jgi:hypothetical protein
MNIKTCEICENGIAAHEEACEVCGTLNVVVGRTYKNKKNGLTYEVKAIGSHTEREEIIVYYVPLYPTIAKWKHCFRPFNVFVEKFEWADCGAKKYLVIFHNRFASETQTFKVTANSDEEAEVKFYEKHPMAYFHECVERVVEV